MSCCRKGSSCPSILAPEVPQIVGDRTQLQQVIVNLTMNAVQAMTRLAPAGRMISLRTVLADPEEGVLQHRGQRSGY